MTVLEFASWIAAQRERTVAEIEDSLIAKFALAAVEEKSDEHTREECTYYTHYLVFYSPEAQGTQLGHSSFHHAEKRCEAAHKALFDWMDKHPDARGEPEHLARQCDYWERKVAA